MIDVAATVRDRLLSLSAVTALVGTRVTTGTRPQSDTRPAILVYRAGEVQTEHLRGGESLRMSRVHVALMDTTRAGVEALQTVVVGDGAGSALDYWFGTAGSPSVEVRLMQPFGATDDYSAAERREFRTTRIYRVFHRL